MTLLRRVLYWQAAVWAASGLLEVAVPRWFLETLFRQPPSPDLAYVRATGVMCVAFALLMVLVAQKLEDVWWWAWVFAITDAGLGTICALNALLGPVEGSAALYWWLLAAVNVVFGAGLLIGLAGAGEERPFV
jgi:hypothetical protein